MVAPPGRRGRVRGKPLKRGFQRLGQRGRLANGGPGERRKRPGNAPVVVTVLALDQRGHRAGEAKSGIAEQGNGLSRQGGRPDFPYGVVADVRALVMGALRDLERPPAGKDPRDGVDGRRNPKLEDRIDGGLGEGPCPGAAIRKMIRRNEGRAHHEFGEIGDQRRREARSDLHRDRDRRKRAFRLVGMQHSAQNVREFLCRRPDEKGAQAVALFRHQRGHETFPSCFRHGLRGASRDAIPKALPG